MVPRMTPVRRLLPWCAPCLVVLSASAEGTPVSRMPDRSKAQRVGYVVEVEGGEEGPQSVYIAEKPKRQPGSPAPVAASAPANASAQVAPRATEVSAKAASSADPKAEKSSFWSRLFSSREETPDMDHSLNKAAKMEDNLSSRRFEGGRSDILDSRYERREAVGFEMWDRRFDTYGRKRNESVDMSSRFETGMVDKAKVTYDKKDFNDFERRSEKAEVKNWNERQARTLSDQFSDPDKRMSFQDRMATGYSLMTKVSMQDINRYQYRRNRSDEKGALPVAKPGAETTSMNATR